MALKAPDSSSLWLELHAPSVPDRPILLSQHVPPLAAPNGRMPQTRLQGYLAHQKLLPRATIGPYA